MLPDKQTGQHNFQTRLHYSSASRTYRLVQQDRSAAYVQLHTHIWLVITWSVTLVRP